MSLLRWILLTVSNLFLIGGIINFFIFLSWSYYAAAVWCLFIGVAAGLIAHLNYLMYRNLLSSWYGLEELDYLNRLSFTFIAVTISGLVYHLVYCGLRAYYDYSSDAATVQASIFSAIAGFWSVILKLQVDKIYGRLISLN